MISKSKTANHAQTLNLTRNQYVQSENCPSVSDSSAQISSRVLGQTKQNSAGKLVETFSQHPSSLTDKPTNSTKDDILREYRTNKTRDTTYQELGLDLHSMACLTS